MNYKYNPGHGGNYGRGKFERGCDVQKGVFAETGRFGRMLPYLRSLKSFDPPPADLGKVGGPMDGGADNPDNERIKAGYTFLGQFIDHDLTLDATSNLEQQIDPQAIRNFRTPALELDNVYGLGPKVQPYLYQKDNPGKMLLSPDEFDLPRNTEGIALIGDPRNDENIIVSQFHRLMLMFHNKVFDQTPGPGTQERFEEAQRIVRWHYQWIVINEFLPRIVGKSTIKHALEHVPFKFTEKYGAFMPLEFSVAAYRFGHTQVRPGYAINDNGGAGLFPADPAAPESPRDLRGRRPVPDTLRVDWVNFFGPAAQPSKLIDIRISTPLLQLPNSVVDPQTAGVGSPDAAIRSLASRNLQRGIDAELPSGQAVARHFKKVRKLTEEQIWKDVPGGKGEAPLWFYCLREAEVFGKGLRLAAAGAQIVAQTFAAILEADKASYYVREPEWKPHLGPEKGRFTVSDLVNFTLGTNLAQEDLDSLPDAETPARSPALEPAE